MSQVRSRWPQVGSLNGVHADLDRIASLCDRGLFLQAYEIARPHGPLHTWSGIEALLVAGGLAGEIGGLRMGCALLLQVADRRTSPEALVQAGRALLNRRGPLEAWTRTKAWGEPGHEAFPGTRADWLALRARIVARFRDFATAETLWRRAVELAPDRPATWVARAEILSAQDLRAEALEAAREALRLDPVHGHAVAIAASQLLSLGRMEETLDLLLRAHAATESCWVSARLATLLFERGDHEETLRCLDRFEARAPLLEREERQWLEGRRSDAFYALGDLERARIHAREAATPFHAALVGRLAGGNRRSRRVRLPVPFVQQDHGTCSPATLATLAGYFGRPVEQAQVAQAICYDGTPLHKSRAWAEENGWVVREFRVTWASACALLDRGVPFAFCTASAMFGHHQTVVGYDARRNTLFVRCPSDPILQEYPAEVLAQFDWCGPRGLVLVPPQQEHLLDGLELPDGPLYDALHALETALERHKPAEAEAIQERLANTAPRHPLALWGRLRLAGYHADAPTRLECVRGLLDLFPETPSLLFMELSILRELDEDWDYRRRLEDACSRHPHDPSLVSRWAYELALHSCEHDQARRILRTEARWCGMPADALNLVSLAHLAQADRPDEARELFRFAACLEGRNESYARVYFYNAQADLEGALGFLRSRAAALGRQSPAPMLTLVDALLGSGRRQEGLEVLDHALARHPDDGPLKLSAARLCAAEGQLERAETLLIAARGRVRRADWDDTSHLVIPARKRAAFERFDPSRAPRRPPASRPAPAKRPVPIPRVAAPSQTHPGPALHNDPPWLQTVSWILVLLLQLFLRQVGAQ